MNLLELPEVAVAENIRYGLRGVSANEQQLRPSELLEQFQLQDLAARYPHQDTKSRFLRPRFRAASAGHGLRAEERKAPLVCRQEVPC